MPHRPILAAALACALAAPALAEGPAAPPFAAFDGASEQVLADPHDLVIGPDGRLYVADKFAGRIAVFDPDTLELVDSIGGGALVAVRDVGFMPDGRMVVAASGLGQVLVYDVSGEAPQLVESLPAPGTEGALAHSNGRIYAMVNGACAVAAYEGDEVVKAVRVPCGGHDVAEGPDGSIWAPDLRTGFVARFSPDLDYLGGVGGPHTGCIGARYLAFDFAGRMAVTCQEGHAVVLIDPATDTLVGAIGDGTPGMGPGKFDDPEGAANDGARWFFSDSDNNRIVRYAVVTN
ncbi:hypothetical protein ACQ5SO_13295 [Rhodovulum sp. DZ06]|uniref:Vgb family protein n=1 Tax=Rhodovulum sp. DZ06 TaxID=3425126 RepID=UPI003D354BAD